MGEEGKGKTPVHYPEKPENQPDSRGGGASRPPELEKVDRAAEQAQRETTSGEREDN